MNALFLVLFISLLIIAHFIATIAQTSLVVSICTKKYYRVDQNYYSLFIGSIAHVLV